MQAKLLDIFGRLKTLMKKYEDPLKPKFDWRAGTTSGRSRTSRSPEGSARR